MQKPPEKLRPGDELTIGWLNTLRDWVLRNTLQFGVDSGLAVSQSPTGTSIRAVTQSTGAFLCVTDGTITACGAFSGGVATAGSGTVFICTTKGTTITQGTETLTVNNFSTTTGGIPTGVNVWVTEDDEGNYWITAVDCGN